MISGLANLILAEARYTGGVFLGDFRLKYNGCHDSLHYYTFIHNAKALKFCHGENEHFDARTLEGFIADCSLPKQTTNDKT